MNQTKKHSCCCCCCCIFLTTFDCLPLFWHFLCSLLVDLIMAHLSTFERWYILCCISTVRPMLLLICILTVIDLRVKRRRDEERTTNTHSHSNTNRVKSNDNAWISYHAELNASHSCTPLANVCMFHIDTPLVCNTIAHA